MHSRTLYQTESLELLHLNYHHLHATILDPSALLLLSYVRVIAGSSTLTRPASLQAWQMFARTVEWHHTPLNICCSALHARHNWQLKIYGTIQTRWLIFPSSTTTNEGEELWATTTTTTFRKAYKFKQQLVKSGLVEQNFINTAVNECRKHLCICVCTMGQHFNQFYCRHLKMKQLNEISVKVSKMWAKCVLCII